MDIILQIRNQIYGFFEKYKSITKKEEKMQTLRVLLNMLQNKVTDIPSIESMIDEAWREPLGEVELWIYVNYLEPDIRSKIRELESYLGATDTYLLITSYDVIGDKINPMDEEIVNKFKEIMGNDIIVKYRGSIIDIMKKLGEYNELKIYIVFEKYIPREEEEDP